MTSKTPKIILSKHYTLIEYVNNLYFYSILYTNCINVFIRDYHRLDTHLHTKRRFYFACLLDKAYFFN